LLDQDALIGGIEEGSSPLEIHARRTEYPEGTTLHEGSWWFLLGKLTSSEHLPAKSIAALTRTAFVEDVDEVKAYLADHSVDTRAVCGEWLPQDQRAYLADDLDHVKVMSNDVGWNDCIFGRELHKNLIDENAPSRLVFIDRDPDGAFSVVEIWK
jgi:hypothetical protein